MKTIESIPNAPKTFEALRSLGYDLNSSIADIIDNSISAHSKNIKIYLDRVNKKFRCIVIDDGRGMKDSQLVEAMRLGTDSTYEEGDLGKFGMGMKTASMSHCNLLTVFSKKANCEYSAYRWDLSHVKKTKSWSLIKLDRKEIKGLLKSNKMNIFKSGTIVQWDEMFLIDSEYNSYTHEQSAENYYNRLVRKLCTYLSMVFHRFLDKKSKTELSIKVNGILLKPWNPFCTNEPKTRNVNLSSEVALFKPTESNLNLSIKIKGYVLPTKEEFSSKKAWEAGKGVVSWNDAQGYYIYRANRLIRFGGWHSTKSKDEHDKLARISLDIPIQYDSLFSLTVNKARVHFPESLYNHLKNQVNGKVLKEAKKRYRKSDENRTIKNRFRNQQERLETFTQDLLKNKKIIIYKDSESILNGNVHVKKPNGSFISNSLSELIKYNFENNFSIEKGKVEKGLLWKLICDPKGQKFKIILNPGHPFYVLIYENSKKKVNTAIVDALLYTMAFAELYSKSTQNGHIFDEIRSTMSDTLAQLSTQNLF